MSKINPSELLIRCSALGDIMGKKPISEAVTAQRQLMKLYRQKKYNRNFSTDNKFTLKGKRTEDDGITLLSLSDKKYFKKNTDRLNNEYLTGEPDLYIGESVGNADEVLDIKNSWSLETFPSAIDAKNTDYFYQIHGYMMLTGAKKGRVIYCLVNTPAFLIQKEKERLFYSSGCPSFGDTDFDKYQEGLIDIEKNGIFDIEQFRRDNPNYDMDCKDWTFDIPREERIFKIEYLRDEIVNESIIKRIKEGREWLASVV